MTAVVNNKYGIILIFGLCNKEVFGGTTTTTTT
ncbi:MAG: hypothetical protein ACJAUQ_001121, partial [Maribacter sp.]